MHVARGDWSENSLIDRNEVQIEDNMQGCNEANEVKKSTLFEGPQYSNGGGENHQGCRTP